MKDVLDMLAGGSTRAEILRDYPYLQDEDITAALEFAARGGSSDTGTRKTEYRSPRRDVAE